MMNIKNSIKLVMIIIIVFTLISIVSVKYKLNKEKYQGIEKKEDIEVAKIDDASDDSICVIDIKGAIMNPGVYTTSCHDNVSDVIRLAGGLTEEADTSVTNLAKKVTNEMVIIIYTKEEVKNSNIVDTVVKVVEQECICPNVQNDGCINDKINDTIGGDNLVNINTATIDELKSIPGIGQAKAEAIINYRKQYGNFKTIEDIKNVNGIGNSLYEEIKAYLTT